MDASVGFLLENLKLIAVHHINLFKGAENELKQLESELDEFKGILEEASRKSKKDEIFLRWERQIREAVYDIEDAIDTCVTEAAAGSRGKKWFKNLFSNTTGTLALAEQVTNLRLNTVKPLMDKFQRAHFTIADAPDTLVDDARKIRQQKSQHIVGLIDETKMFVDQLTGDSDKMEVSSIIGMGGLGKTTLAWKIFENSTIQFEFSVRIWINVSDHLNMQKVLLDILSKFTSAKPVPSATEEDLAREVKAYLEDAGKFLIVMDDIWTTDAWKNLKALLPTNNILGRVLITTREKIVGNKASTHPPHLLDFLDPDNSWDLLQHEAFGKLGDVPEELVEVGRTIATNCKGLPLSIVVIGGILEEKTNTKSEWEKVSKSLNSYLVGDRKGMLGSIISLSYEKLPYQLRNCFLYLGIFPEDADIPVKKLIRLWIAEGFIQEIGGMSLEDVASNNLKDLINRNLLMVRVAKPGGEPKICHVHDSIREICKQEGGKLNLFKEISKFEVPEGTANFRRLSIHSHALDFFSQKPKLPKARSFLCFNESPMTLKAGDIASITDAFGLLRVYDAKDLKFPLYPKKLVQQLNHLRYLTLTLAFEFNMLPEAVTNLWNLETLIVQTLSETLEIKGDIWKMRRLRHFKTQASIIMNTKGGDKGGKKIQTLSRLWPESCTVEVCKKASSLITLGIQGDLRNFEGSKCLGELDSLNKLKLVHQVSHGGAADNPLKHLPNAHSFPPNIKIIVLSGTRLDWGKMSIFSAIGTLEELKIKEHAFQGSIWKAADNRFGELVTLYIGRTDMQRWTTGTDNFPKLRFLYINNCEKLAGIPTALGKKLEVLSLKRVTQYTVNSAKKIREEQDKLGRVVKLDIAAADINQRS